MYKKFLIIESKVILVSIIKHKTLSQDIVEMSIIYKRSWTAHKLKVRMSQWVSWKWVWGMMPKDVDLTLQRLRLKWSTWIMKNKTVTKLTFKWETCRNKEILWRTKLDNPLRLAIDRLKKIVQIKKVKRVISS